MHKYEALLVGPPKGLAVDVKVALSNEDSGCAIEPFREIACQILSSSRFDVCTIWEGVDGELDIFCRKIRRIAPGAAIVACLDGGKNEIEQQLLEAGVDGIVRGRVSPSALARRIVSHVRNRYRPVSPQETMRLGDVVVDFNGLLVHRNGSAEKMTKGLARLLKYFVANPQRVITRKEVVEAVWTGSVVDPEGRNLDMQMVKLRRLTECDPKRPAFFKTIRGVGYMFDDQAMA